MKSLLDESRDMAIGRPVSGGGESTVGVPFPTSTLGWNRYPGHRLAEAIQTIGSEWLPPEAQCGMRNRPRPNPEDWKSEKDRGRSTIKESISGQKY
jgi:hypothetical protein